MSNSKKEIVFSSYCFLPYTLWNWRIKCKKVRDRERERNEKVERTIWAWNWDKLIILEVGTSNYNSDHSLFNNNE